MPKYKIFGAEPDIEIPKDCFIKDDELEAMEATMPGCEHGWFHSVYQGAKLHYRKWLPSNASKPKGIVVHMHGISASCGRGLIVMGDANANANHDHDGNHDNHANHRKINTALEVQVLVEEHGYALYAFEQYGHGYSEGTRFLIPQTWQNNLQDYVNFCNLVADEHDKDIPFFLQGESYGGSLTIHAAKQFQEDPASGPSNFDSILLVAPAIEGDLPPTPVYQILRYGLAPMFPTWTPFFMPNPISPDRIWRDEEVRKLRSSPRSVAMGLEGGGRPFRLGTALNLVLALEEVRNRAIPGLKVPFCILHGTADYGVMIQGSEFMMDKAETPMEDKEFHRIDGAYHDLFADPLAEECMEHTLNWVLKRTKAFHQQQQLQQQQQQLKNNSQQ
jgi:alpha-beta hydrolase superfamily lysophospholipase